MASINDSVSLEYLESLYNQPNGIPTLDSSGKLADFVSSDFLGAYSTLSGLQTAYPTAPYGKYATVNGVVYYYNSALSTPRWSSAEIGVTAYRALTDTEKAGQPQWIIIPDPA